MTVALDIVLVNWNAGDQLRTCLQSVAVAARDSFELQRVVVVDNGSTDDSLQGLEQIPLPLQIIRNGKNRGFAAGCNQGAADSKADYLLFLNCDTKLFPDTLTNTITFMEQPENTPIGICGIRLINKRGEPGIAAARFPTLHVMLGKMTGLSQLFPRLFPSHFLRTDEMITNRYVDQVMGSYFLIRKTVYDQCNGFDERFFVYYEEVDLALRAKAAGHSSYYLADVTAFHAEGGLSAQVKARRLFYSLRSRIYYAQKHYTPWAFILLILLTFTVELPIRIGYALLLISPAQVGETIAGYLMLTRHFLWSRTEA